MRQILNGFLTIKAVPIVSGEKPKHGTVSRLSISPTIQKIYRPNYPQGSDNA
jgi:hypothetical protein